jgi:hypothetical protein
MANINGVVSGPEQEETIRAFKASIEEVRLESDW